jgi:hypothetical protein
METNPFDQLPSTALSEWLKIGQKLFDDDLPRLRDVWNPLFKAKRAYHRHSSDKVPMIHKYFLSFDTTCQQALYAAGRLTYFDTREPEPSDVPSEFYVATYLSTFIGRIKTATDILALIIRHVYDLPLRDNACSLENGKLVGALRKNASLDTSNLSRVVDTLRTEWLIAFDELRDHVIHRAGLQFIGVGEVHRIHISLSLPNDLLREVQFLFSHPTKRHGALNKWMNNEPLTKFIVQTSSKSLTWHLSVDPVVLCDELWALLMSAANRILEICNPRILELISKDGI